jgi:UDP-glucose 4-epimerase
MGELLGRPAHLIAVPVPWLQGIGRWLGRGAEVGRLTDTLRLDTGLIHRTLGWRAPISAAEGLERTVAWYRTTW